MSLVCTYMIHPIRYRSDNTDNVLFLVLLQVKQLEEAKEDTQRLLLESQSSLASLLAQQDMLSPSESSSLGGPEPDLHSRSSAKGKGKKVSTKLPLSNSPVLVALRSMKLNQVRCLTSCFLLHSTETHPK
jgi:hypothetical protein